MDRKTLTTTGALAAIFLAGVTAHALMTEPARAQSGGGAVSVSASADGSRAWVVAGDRVMHCTLGQYGPRCTG